MRCQRRRPARAPGRPLHRGGRGRAAANIRVGVLAPRTQLAQQSSRKASPCPGDPMVCRSLGAQANRIDCRRTGGGAKALRRSSHPRYTAAPGRNRVGRRSTRRSAALRAEPRRRRRPSDRASGAPRREECGWPRHPDHQGGQGDLERERLEFQRGSLAVMTFRPTPIGRRWVRVPSTPAHVPAGDAVRARPAVGRSGLSSARTR
jgi:hypothetical protein